MIDEILKTAFICIFVLQCVFSGVGQAQLIWDEHRSDLRSREGVAALCYGTAYWMKSVLIAVAVIWGPERHGWVVLYTAIAIGIYGIGDIGLRKLGPGYPRRF